jgi:hypothetical protein
MSTEAKAVGVPADDVLRVLEMTQRLADNFDLDSLLAEVLEAGMELLGAEMGALWLYRHDTRELVSLLPRLEVPLRVAEGEGLSAA